MTHRCRHVSTHNLEMGIYEERILPRLIDRLLASEELSKLRRETCRGLSGTVLEVGFGSGLNVPHLPDSVTKVLAVDPSCVARRLAEPRIRTRGVSVDFVGLDGARLDLESDSVDHVLCTMTLCTIPDVEAAIREVRRVVKPGGTFAFLEHGLAPEPNVARWQRRLTPMQRRLFGGCHLDRSSFDLVAAGGFRLLETSAAYQRGPKVVSYFTRGLAQKT